jgi:C_GCAxxG_C_C family probable redox protein
MQRKEKVIELFKQQFNCSQAVFAAYRQTDVLDEESALKLSTILGAGVSCTGSELCGAVTGALLAISMRYGRGDLQSIEAKTKTYQLGRDFMAEFQSRVGSCTCETILGLNIGTPENLVKARDMKLFETRCLNAVSTASDILEEVL